MIGKWPAIEDMERTNPGNAVRSDAQGFMGPTGPAIALVHILDGSFERSTWSAILPNDMFLHQDHRLFSLRAKHDLGFQRLLIQSLQLFKLTLCRGSLLDWRAMESCLWFPSSQQDGLQGQ
jgi:hypothetical protein